ncbi:MAG TPA: NrfD/PsrC family molybdoenzyme membrane anchor subunit [Phycisphaerales bacterium]|nr:NrfD/PsrC family molybdoenzyme membrane anchor subunit [Phycisphaerales bacterium]
MTSIHPDQLNAQRLAGVARGPTPPPVNDPSTGDGTLIDTPGVRPPLILNQRGFGEITDIVCGYTENKPPRWWLPAFLSAFGLAQLGGVMILYLVITGIGTWGLNNRVDWAWDITNFVFWIGIGHAGTLISAILCLLKQKWRTSINRSAEAMTIFAVICAATFPGIHIGRQWMAWMLAPVPTANAIWPNFKSPLLWDVFAVSTYGTVSLLFWYMGMIPDFATLRDRADRRLRRSPDDGPTVAPFLPVRSDKIRAYVYGFLAMGWRFSSRHWHRYEAAYLVLAGISTPLVLSVHSIVSFDFATSIVPGWHTTIFPPYFVAGAIFGGFAMVLLLLIPARQLYPNMKDLVTLRHIENMAKIILVTGMMVGFAYSMEFFIAWYGANFNERYAFQNRMFGPYWWAYWTMISCNVISPQVFWNKKMRTNVVVVFIVSVLVTIGMWFERFVIIVTSLHRAFLPGQYGMFEPSLVDIGIFAGSFGVFLTLFLLFLRFLPAFPMAEIKAVLPQASPHGLAGHGAGDDSQHAGTAHGTTKGGH